jgi:hypothetical protein
MDRFEKNHRLRLIVAVLTVAVITWIALFWLVFTGEPFGGDLMMKEAWFIEGRRRLFWQYGLTFSALHSVSAALVVWNLGKSDEAGDWFVLAYGFPLPASFLVLPWIAALIPSTIFILAGALLLCGRCCYIDWRRRQWIPSLIALTLNGFYLWNAWRYLNNFWDVFGD